VITIIYSTNVFQDFNEVKTKAVVIFPLMINDAQKEIRDSVGGYSVSCLHTRTNVYGYKKTMRTTFSSILPCGYIRKNETTPVR